MRKYVNVRPMTLAHIPVIFDLSIELYIQTNIFPIDIMIEKKPYFW